MNDSAFIDSWKHLEKIVMENARNKGFYEVETHDAVRIALMHSELSEALESMRQGNPQSRHIGKFSSVEEELADTVIRIIDFSAHKGLKIGEAIVKKIEFNTTRPYKHGGKLF